VSVDASLDSTSERSRSGVMASLRAHALVITIGLVVGAVLGFGGSALLPTEYTATSSIYFDVSAPFSPTVEGGGGGGDPVRFIADQAALVTTSEVLKKAGDSVKPPVPVDDVRDSVKAVPSANVSQVIITAVRPTAEQARDIANAVARAYRDISKARVDKAKAEAIAAVANPPDEEKIALAAAAYGDGTSAIEDAVLPETRSAPAPLTNALFGGLVGLFLVAGVNLLRDQRKARRASVADLDLMLGAPLLTRYPSPPSRSIGDLVNADPTTDRFRAANDVLTAIDVRLEGVRRPSVLLLSWQVHLSTTALTVSVALAAAREGRPVVVVDGGGKERGISSLTDVSPGRGLQGLANAATPIGASLRKWRVGNTELGVVPLSEWAPTPTSAAARPQVLRAAMERLRESSVLNLVDGPPLTERSLGLALGRGVDGVVLVLDENTSVDDAQEMGRRIGLAGVAPIGYVLVRASRRRVIRQTERVARESFGYNSDGIPMIDEERAHPGRARA
jgi:capsular polysaccharide biosynthesis protein